MYALEFTTMWHEQYIDGRYETIKDALASMADRAKAYPGFVEVVANTFLPPSAIYSIKVKEVK